MRVATPVLREAGLQFMRDNGKPLTRAKRRGQVYEMENGETVRVRTNNDRVLMSHADNPSTPDAYIIGIENCDWLLIVMPEVKRTEGKVAAYLIPSPVVANALREGHQAWLDEDPDTGGENTLFNLWFDEAIPTAPKSGGFAAKWSQYRLASKNTSNPATENDDGTTSW